MFTNRFFVKVKDMRITEYNKKVYSELAERYESFATEKRKLSVPIMKRLSKHITTGKELLDIGCAIGLHIKIFEEIGFKVTGIDISKDMVEFAKRRNPKAKIYCGDFMRIKINKKFDGILAQAFIHLYPKSKVGKVLDKISSILKKRGVLFVTTSKSKVSKQGYFSKRGHSRLIKRYRKYWTKRELEEVLSKRFEIIDYFEERNPLGEKLMIFTARKK